MTSSITESRKKSGWKIKLNTVFSETTLVDSNLKTKLISVPFHVGESY